ncbi:MAG TPA: metallophosphoesterase, partial [Ornithinibacter sp.]|nr:metallophosphoesterase [Ornithinibacter sp.]
LGWLADVTSPSAAGTTGQARQMEALRIAGGTLAGDIDYRAHVASIGWLGWVGPAYVAGTTGQARRMEAVQVRLTGQAATDYRVGCQAHVANLGWLPVVYDGATCGTTGQARRMEAVRLWLVPRTPAPEPTPTPTTPTADGTTRIALTADTGMEASGAAVMAAIGSSQARWVGILGDLAYQPGDGIEGRWCDWVRARVSQPVSLVPGNHEAQDGDGVYSRFANCLPDRLGVTGDYATGHYYLDDGPVRVIMTSPGITLPQGTRTYGKGTVEREQVKDWIDEAKAKGQWVIVGMHMPCLTNGAHGCSSDPTYTDMLLGKKVDLIVAGHDHNYGRSHQIAGTVAAPTIVDRDGTFTAGAGSVLAIVGNGGHNPRAASSGGIWAVTSDGTSAGYALVEATPERLTFTERGIVGPALTDTITITR